MRIFTYKGRSFKTDGSKVIYGSHEIKPLPLGLAEAASLPTPCEVIDIGDTHDR